MQYYDTTFMTTLHKAPIINIIVATDKNRGIGIHNTLPWHLPEDLAHFKNTTSGHAIIMGRKTFDSIGRPLPKRENIVVTRNAEWQHENVTTALSLKEAIAQVSDDEVFIIGGAQIYHEAIHLADRLIITQIDHIFDCDAFFPEVSQEQWHVASTESHHSEKNGWDYTFVTYEKNT